MDVYLLTSVPYDVRPTVELALDCTVPYLSLDAAKDAALNEIKVLYAEESASEEPAFVLSWEHREFGRDDIALVEDWTEAEPHTRLSIRIAHYRLGKR